MILGLPSHLGPQGANPILAKKRFLINSREPTFCILDPRFSSTKILENSVSWIFSRKSEGLATLRLPQCQPHRLFSTFKLPSVKVAVPVRLASDKFVKISSGFGQVTVAREKFFPFTESCKGLPCRIPSTSFTSMGKRS